jgi:hypothetical protein
VGVGVGVGRGKHVCVGFPRPHLSRVFFFSCGVLVRRSPVDWDSLWVPLAYCSRHELRCTLGQMVAGLTRFRQRAADSGQPGGADGALWSLPANFRLPYKALEGELKVGGVYVRLFLKEPTYPLRNPQVWWARAWGWPLETRVFLGGCMGLQLVAFVLIMLPPAPPPPLCQLQLHCCSCSWRAYFVASCKRQNTCWA